MFILVAHAMFAAVGHEHGQYVGEEHRYCRYGRRRAIHWSLLNKTNGDSWLRPVTSINWLRPLAAAASASMFYQCYTLFCRLWKNNGTAIGIVTRHAHLSLMKRSKRQRTSRRRIHRLTHGDTPRIVKKIHCHVIRLKDYMPAIRTREYEYRNKSHTKVI